jgi:hypothetical protein
MGDVIDFQQRVMERMLEELQGMREELRGTNARLDKVEVRLLHIEAHVAQTNVRFDHLLEFTGEKWRDLDRRVTALEQQRAAP